MLDAACVKFDLNASVGDMSDETTPSPVRERATVNAAPALEPVMEAQDQDWDTDVTTAKLLAGLEPERSFGSMPSVTQSDAVPSQGFPRIRLESAFETVAQNPFSVFKEQPPPPLLPALFGPQSSFCSSQGNLLAPLGDSAAASSAPAPNIWGSNSMQLGLIDNVSISRSEYERLLVARTQTEQLVNVIEQLEDRLEQSRALVDAKSRELQDITAKLAQAAKCIDEFAAHAKQAIASRDSEIEKYKTAMQALISERNEYVHAHKTMAQSFRQAIAEKNEEIKTLATHVDELKDKVSSESGKKPGIFDIFGDTDINIPISTPVFDLTVNDGLTDCHASAYGSCKSDRSPEDKVGQILNKYRAPDREAAASSVGGTISNMLGRVTSVFSTQSRSAAAVSSAGYSMTNRNPSIPNDKTPSVAVVSSTGQYGSSMSSQFDLNSAFRNLGIDASQRQTAQNTAAVSSAGYSSTSFDHVFGLNAKPPDAAVSSAGQVGNGFTTHFISDSRPLDAAVSSAGRVGESNNSNSNFHQSHQLGAAVLSAGQVGRDVHVSSKIMPAAAAVSSAGQLGQVQNNVMESGSMIMPINVTAPGDNLNVNHEEKERRDKADNIDLDPMPLPNELRNWKKDLFERVANAYFRDTDKGFSWISEINRATCLEDLQDNPLPALEAKLSNAIMKSIRRDPVFKQKIDRHVDEFHMKGLRLRSRQVIWLMFEYLKPREIGEGVYDLKDLMSVELRADHRKCNIQQLENFMLRWETCLTGMKKEPDEDTKLTLFKKQIENIELLDFDMQGYKRIRDPTMKTYSYLFHICQNLINMRRLEENQRLVHRSTRRSQSPVRAAPAPRTPSRGRTSRSLSRSRRDKGSNKSKSPRRSTSPSNGRRRPKSPGHKSNRKNTTCFDFQKGKCTRGWMQI